MIPFLNFEEDFLTTEDLLFLAGASGVKGVEDTATGNPLTFQTDLARPLKSLLIPFTPVQSGTGDPSPENIRSILPWDGLKVVHAGKNWFDENVNQSFTQYKRIDLANPIPAGTYVFTATVEGTTESSYVNIAFAKEHNVLLAKEKLNNHERGSVTFTVADEVNIIYLYADVGYSEGAGKDVKYSGILITSEAPTETDISFPSPVYGGTLDVVSGVLTVEWGIYEPTGTEGVYIEASNNRIAFAIPNEYRTQDTTDVYCTHFKAQTAGAYCYITTSMTVDELKAFFSNNSVEIACKLATPQEITLTPEQITALKGDNTIWSDADGSMTAVYLKNG